MPPALPFHIATAFEFHQNALPTFDTYICKGTYAHAHTTKLSKAPTTDTRERKRKMLLIARIKRNEKKQLHTLGGYGRNNKNTNEMKREKKRKEGQATRGWCSLLTILFEKKHFISALIMSTPNTLKVLNLVDINYNSEWKLVGLGLRRNQSAYEDLTTRL